MVTKKLKTKFVDTFLRKDDETIEEAKERLNKEQEERKKINKRSVYNLKKSSRFSFLCVP